MGENEENHDDTTSLSQLFDKSLLLHNEILESEEETCSPEYQDRVKKGILMLEDATRLVSLLDIFSRNELFTEIETEYLKYFLLPVLLGDLTNKLTEGGRAEVVEAAQIYYIDYLQRCKDYGFHNIGKIPVLVSLAQETGGQAEAGVEQVTRVPDMQQMNAERAAKMSRYKQNRELEQDIKQLKVVLAGVTRDEDVLRDYYLKLIQRFVNTSLDELCSLEMEVGVLIHMAKVKAGKISPEPEKPPRKLQPVIITKDKLQKEVYGLGYPSMPVLSVDEFYEKRVRDGWWKPPSSGGALQDRANDPELEARMKEQEEREKDEKEDRDDAETREKTKAWDEWTDDHRRGEGNRHNMG